MEVSAFRIFKKLLLVVIISFFCIFLFIQFDTEAAADFTDNYLRPILGAETVVFFERVYFNLVDHFQKTAYHLITPESPQFQDQNDGKVSSTGNLDLTPIPVNKSFVPVKNEGRWIGKKLHILEITSFALPAKELLIHAVIDWQLSL